MLRKLGDKYQIYSTTYKTHTMTNHYAGTEHIGEDRELNSHIKDIGGIDIDPNNDNESTNSSDITIAFGGLKADGHLGNPLRTNQANLTVPTREINSLQQ